MNNHLILSCHESDYETMAALLAGMDAHSDFVTSDMNELWRYGEGWGQAITAITMGPKPKRDAWHGFTFPDFPWNTLLSLLESAPWERVDDLWFIVLKEDDALRYTLPQFSKDICSGDLK